MDMDKLAPEGEEEYEERRAELIEETAERDAKIQEKQAEALEQIAEGESLEKYETVELGNLEMQVKSWLPGDVEDVVLRAQRLGESEDPAEIKKSMETMLSALSEMATEDTYNMAFWREYYDEWGAEGLILAVETVLGPAMDSMEAKKDSVQSFRNRKQGPGVGPGNGSNG